MNLSSTRIFLASVLAASMASAAFAGAAGATPAWFLGGTELEGEEAIFGGAPPNSDTTVPGLTITCNGFLQMTISNNAEEVGEGEVTDLPLANCLTDSTSCTVAAAEAEELPWPSELMTPGGGANYIVVEEVEFGVLFAGEECVLNELLVPFKGSAGGLYDNETETVTFNEASFEATGTELTAFKMPVKWSGVFPMRAVGPLKGQALTIK
jgi:hypothetical protein